MISSIKKITLVGALLLALFLVGSTCSDDADHEEHHGHELHLLDKIQQHQSALQYDFSAIDGIDTASFLEVHPGLPGVKSFFTELRTGAITSYPCTNCHDQPLAQMQAGRDPAVRKAHWDIYMVHAGDQAMNCTTCHAKNNMNQLVSLTGGAINFDESFKLCAQCHSTQYKDWQGGAHGKQLYGWKPPRVAKTCVNCHNPHQPAFPKRFPARLNTNALGD